MEEEVRNKLKTFDDVLVLINDMIRSIDHLMEAIDHNPAKKDDVIGEEKSTNDQTQGLGKVENHE